MPIYAYKCDSCGHAKDVLQKISDAPLSVCPECGAATFKKQLTSAGFHLKGSGWYVTDFRDGAAKAASSGGSTESEKKSDAGSDQAHKPEAGSSKAPQVAASDASAAATTPTTPVAPASSAAATPAAKVTP